jgi:hypothetical protein
MAHHDIPEGRYNVFFPLFDLLFGRIEPACDSTNASRMAKAVSSWDTGEFVFAALTQAALWVWLAGLMIGVRYFWTTRTKM